MKMEDKKNTGFFPFFINIENKSVLIYGGGQIALRRIKTLLKFRAKLTVVSPVFLEEIIKLSEDSKLKLEKREFQKGEILSFDKERKDDTQIILATTSDKKVNECIYLECKKRGIFVNNASNQKQCDFFFPAIVDTDDFVMGITSCGKNTKGVKKIAAKIRQLVKEWEKSGDSKNWN